MARLQLLDFGSPWTPTVSMDLEPGITCLSGPSGCGKSALCRAIVELDPSHGRCRLNDRERALFRAAEWRRHCGYVPAESGWWDATVGEHFMKPLLPGSLQELHLRPDVLTARPEDCSSGERERLAVLRQLQCQPTVVLLDEVGAHLDPEARAALLRLIRSVIEQQALVVLWISHDPDLRRHIGGRELYMDRDGLHP